MINKFSKITGALVLSTLLICLFPTQTVEASQNWWDINYQFRRQITVTTGENSPYNGYAGYTVEMTMDTVSPDIRHDGEDIRIVWWNGSDWQELDRHIIAPNTTSTNIRFKLQADIAFSSSDNNYFVYYGNASAGTGPANLDNVYLHYDDFSTDRSGEYNIGRLDVSNWHGTGVYDPPYDATNQRISYDTGDNYSGEWIVADIDERDVYLEIQLRDRGKYPTNTTPGLLARIQWDTPGASINDFYSASFSQGSYNESGIGRNARNAITSAYDPAGTKYYANDTTYRFYFAVWGTNATNFKADFVSDSGQFQWQPEATPYVNGASTEATDLETSGQVGFLVAQQSGWIDELMVRRYIEPEPVVIVGVEEPIPVIIVTTNEATDIIVDSARLNGNLDDLGTAVSADVSFELAETPGGPYLNETTPQTMSATGAFSFDLSSLTPNTTYYFRFKAVGDSTGYGAEKSFTTLTPPTVTTNEATDITINSARLNGNLDDLGTAAVIDVSFEWGETAGGPYPNETTIQTMNTAGVFNFNLNNLIPGTTYYFRVKAAGDSTVYGAEKTFTTLTPPTVTTSDATNAGADSACLNGNLDDPGSAASVELSFEWGQTAGGPYPYETASQTMNTTGVFNFNLNNLTPGTTYYFRAKAVGDSTVYGAEKTITTLANSTGTIPLVENDTEPTHYFLDITAQQLHQQFLTDVSGRLLETVDITLSDGVLNIQIPKRTILSDKDYKRLETLDISLGGTIPVSSGETYFIGPVYTLLPEGAIFNPAITLTWNYDPDILPEGISEEDLFLAYYDTNTADWTRINGIIDTVNHMITVEISHPMTLAACYVKPALDTLAVNTQVEYQDGNVAGLNDPAVVQDINEDPNEPLTTTNSPTSNENNWLLIVVIAFGVVALASIISYLFMTKRS